MWLAIRNFFRSLVGRPEIGILTGSTVTAENLAVRQANIVWVSSPGFDGQKVLTARTSSFGKFEMEIPMNTAYTLEATSARYKFGRPMHFEAGYLGAVNFMAAPTQEVGV